ncbi:hypothetical protein LOD99_12177 [Oopsacas minuta]|uniref:Uncharacterized protein n=1 Tax=Oopsacas minuta TaxID=111878 RepID=A0AAV7JI46_9METZ|nr:hypothetical protein LOD99_12177 [Oopsacas minuta]
MASKHVMAVSDENKINSFCRNNSKLVSDDLGRKLKEVCLIEDADNELKGSSLLGKILKEQNIDPRDLAKYCRTFNAPDLGAKSYELAESLGLKIDANEKDVKTITEDSPVYKLMRMLRTELSPECISKKLPGQDNFEIFVTKIVSKDLTELVDMLENNDLCLLAKDIEDLKEEISSLSEECFKSEVSSFLEAINSPKQNLHKGYSLQMKTKYQGMPLESKVKDPNKPLDS